MKVLNKLKINTKTLQKEGHILKAKLNIIKTTFSPFLTTNGNGGNYQDTIKMLML